GCHGCSGRFQKGPIDSFLKGSQSCWDSERAEVIKLILIMVRAVQGITLREKQGGRNGKSFHSKGIWVAPIVNITSISGIKIKSKRKEVSMKPTLFALVLFLAAAVFAQQPGQSPPTSPPQSTPPTFPEERAPRQQMPPDQEAPPQGLSS